MKIPHHCRRYYKLGHEMMKMLPAPSLVESEDVAPAVAATNSNRRMIKLL
jgi:hypothetical protein